MCCNRPQKGRRGALAPLGAILIVPVLGMTAFSVDLGWIALTKSQLKNAADAAAIAAAGQLIEGHVLYNLPRQTQKDVISSSAQAAALTYARRIAGCNSAGGVRLAQVNASDVRFGITDVSRHYTTLGASGGYPNTVHVTLRRDTSANSPLNLFFARLWGVASTELSATSAATIFTGTAFQGFRYDSQLNGMLLPVALDVNVWNQFLATGVSSDGKIYSGPNGAPQLKVYPCPKNAPGNFGLLCVGPPSSSVTSFRDWIDYGPSPTDLQYLCNQNQLPLSATTPKIWIGGPGLENTLGTNFEGILGRPRLLPVFTPVSQSPYLAASDQGSNAGYRLVGFVGATISEVRGNGINLEISVQPCAVLDPTAVYQTASVTPAVSGSQLITTAAAPKLTE